MSINIFNTFNDPSALTGTTQAFGLNDADQIVGYYQDATGNHGYVLSGGTFITLNDPSASGANGTIAFGINASGFVVGGYGVGSITAHGFLSTTPTTALTPPSMIPSALAAPLRSV